MPDPRAETAPTMSEARRFQQLKAHLSYLKLDNAAEALPSLSTLGESPILT